MTDVSKLVTFTEHLTIAVITVSYLNFYCIAQLKDLASTYLKRTHGA